MLKLACTALVLWYSVGKLFRFITVATISLHFCPVMSYRSVIDGRQLLNINYVMASVLWHLALVQELVEI